MRPFDRMRPSGNGAILPLSPFQKKQGGSLGKTPGASRTALKNRAWNLRSVSQRDKVRWMFWQGIVGITIGEFALDGRSADQWVNSIRFGNDSTEHAPPTGFDGHHVANPVIQSKPCEELPTVPITPLTIDLHNFHIRSKPCGIPGIP